MSYEPEQFIALAQAQHETQFPNPERRGCPPPGQMTSQIWQGALPDASLRQHLFTCSECFQEYRAQLAAYHAAQPAPAAWWQRWTESWSLKLATAIALFVLLTGSGWFVWQRMTTPQPIQIVAQTQATPLPPVPAPQSAEQRATLNEETRQTAQPPVAQTMPAAPIVQHTIDLNEYVALRDVRAGNTAENPIRLAAERLRLQLTLPEGSAKGRYTVRLVDAFGRAVRRASAFSSNGQTLTVTLDLRSRTAQRYRLQIARGADAPDYYPVTITEKRR